jgi:hypothetical protein
MTTTRDALIEKLVVQLHLSVPDRQLLGSDSVSVEEVAAVVHRVFQQHGVFPPHAGVRKPGELVFEGHFLVRRPDGKVELMWQRNHPINPTELAERDSTLYVDPDQAVQAFIEKEWSRGIDGIRLIGRNANSTRSRG